MMFPSICSSLTSSLCRYCYYLGPNDFMPSSYQTLIDTCITENVLHYVAGDWKKESGMQAVHILNACFLDWP